MTHTDPILLVGPQRSGTTALAAAMSAALAVAGGCFTVNGKLPYLLRRWWTDTDAAARHLRQDEVFHALARIPPQGVGSVAWLARTRTALLASARRAARGHAAPYARDEIRRVCSDAYGPGPWGDKYNEYLLELPWLHATFPDARWVFLVREPGETVASMLDWRRDKPWNPDNAWAAAAKWAYWTSRWLAFRETIPLRQRVELDYADLCEGHSDALSLLVGVELTPFLADFRRPSLLRPAPSLCRDAQAIHQALVELRILNDSRRS
jgi:Sulfotransferase family